MNTFTFTLREDWRTLRWLLPAWICVLAVNYKLQPALAQGPEDWLQLRYGIVALAWGAAWLIVLGQLAFAHPAAEPRAAWRSRPLRGDQVAWAKLATGALVLVLLPAIASVLTAKGPQAWSWPAIGEFLLGSLTVHAVFFGVLLFVASLCRKSSHYLGAILALGLGGPLLLIVGGLGLRRGIIHFFDYPPWVALLVLGATLTGAITLTVRQYRRSRTRSHLLMAAAFVGALALIEAALPANPDELPRLRTDGARMTASGLRPFNTTGYLSTDVDFAGLDSDGVWRLDEVLAPPTHGDLKRTDFNDDRLLASPAIARQLGLDGYTVEQTETLPRSAHLEPLDDASRNAAPSSSFVAPRKLTAHLVRLELEVLGAIPGAVGSTLESERLHATIVGDSEVLGSPGVTLQLFVATQPRPESRISRGRRPMWVWVDHAKRRASIVQHSGDSSWTTLGAGLRGTFTIPLPGDWDIPPAQLELRVVDVLPQGRLTLHATVQ